MAVLTLAALMTGIVLPAMQRWFDSVSRRAQLFEVSVQFQRLAARAAILSQTIILDKTSWKNKLIDGEAMLPLPEGWSIASDQPLTFFYSGVCGGGQVDLAGPHRQIVTLQVAPASCHLSIVNISQQP